MDGINAGRKTIPFARFDAKRCAQGLESLRSYRTEWDEKVRAFKKTPEHNWASHGADGWRLPVTVLARADARAGGGEGVYRHPPPGHDHGSIHGPRGQLVGAAGQGLGHGAMGDGVWDQVSRSVRNTSYDNIVRPLHGARMGTSPHSEAVLAFAAYGVKGLAVKIRQSTVAQRRPESTSTGHCGAGTNAD